MAKNHLKKLLKSQKAERKNLNAGIDMLNDIVSGKPWVYLKNSRKAQLLNI